MTIMLKDTTAVAAFSPATATAFRLELLENSKPKTKAKR